jgi:hypothetical protein
VEVKMFPRQRRLVACTIVGVVTLWGAWATLLRSQEVRSLEPRDGLVCLLVNRNSGRCLSVAGQSVEANAKIVQGPTPNQAGASEHWSLLSAGQTFRLRNARSGLVLQIWSTNRQKGVQAVQAADQVSQQHQHWTFEPHAGAFLLRAGHSQLVLGVAAGALENGARVIQWNQVPGVQDQLWLLRSTTDVAAAPQDELPPPPQDESRLMRRWRILAVTAGIVVMVALVIVLHQRRRQQPQRTDAVANESSREDGGREIDN